MLGLSDRKMKKNALLLLILAPYSSEAAETIRMMYFSVPPFIIYDEQTKTVSGATYDFVQNYVAPQLGITFSWDKEPTVVPRQLMTLERLDNYASALIVFSPARAKNAAFPESSYYESSSVIAVLNTSRIREVRKIDDIAALTFGYGDDLYIGSFMNDRRIKFDFVSSANFAGISLRKMMLGRIDAAYAPNREHMIYEVRRLHLEDRVRLIELPFERAGMFLAFSKSSGDLVTRYNRTFNDAYVKDIYSKLLSKYIDPSSLR
jgi:hypothetical protein